jgi:acetyl-CoA carboxylase biotin carboxyl carrier protein
MNIDDLRQILEMVREHELVELELEQDGVKLRVRKDPGHQLLPSAAVMSSLPGLAASPLVPVPIAAANQPTTATAALSGPTAVATEDETSLELAVVKSPIVGTFYRTPAPGAAPFVELGTRVKKGQVLCIIEAMKLMNEIESEYDGEIVKIYVESGQPVQYGERLFAIRAT